MGADGASGFVPLDELTVRASVPSVEMQVKQRYDGLAQGGASDVCCAPQSVYSPQELAEIPQWVLDLSSGCGSPLGKVDLQPGQVVVDFGCGAGLDLLLAAKKVGEHGRVVGIDGSVTMVRNARRAAKEAGLSNIDVRVGDLRRPPVRDGSADILLSNCVLGMFPDKGKILWAMARVLRPGGYAVISDVVLVDGVPTLDVTPVESSGAEEFGRCVVGLTIDQYRDLVTRCGFDRVEVHQTGQVSYRDGARVISATIIGRRVVGEAESACCP